MDLTTDIKGVRNIVYINSDRSKEIQKHGRYKFRQPLQVEFGALILLHCAARSGNERQSHRSKIIYGKNVF